MKIVTRTILASIFAASLLPFTVQAEDTTPQEKKFFVGLGTYGLILDSDVSGYKDDEFYGFAISAGYAFTDHFAVKGAYYSLEHDDFSDLEAKGIDLAVLAGTGLATEGFKIYGGLGFFSEKWELSGSSFDEKFSGAQLVGGLGYNWEVISIDLSIGIRDSSDYEDFIEDSININTDVTAVSAALTVSARF